MLHQLSSSTLRTTAGSAVTGALTARHLVRRITLCRVMDPSLDVSGWVAY
jgi:hypothetical protein